MTVWAIEIRSPAEAKSFSYSVCVQTGSGAHRVSCTMDTVGPYPVAKARPGREANQSLQSISEAESE
jgi:hypothetical protein